MRHDTALVIFFVLLLSAAAIPTASAALAPCPNLLDSDPDPFGVSTCAGYTVAVRSLCGCLGAPASTASRAMTPIECTSAAATTNLTCTGASMCLRNFVRQVVALSGARVNTTDSCRSFGETMHVAQMAPSTALANSCYSTMCYTLTGSTLATRCSFTSTTPFCVASDLVVDPLLVNASASLALVGNLTFFSLYPTGISTVSTGYTIDDFVASVNSAVTADLSGLLNIAAPPLTTLNISQSSLYMAIAFAVANNNTRFNATALNRVAAGWTDSVSIWANTRLASVVRAHGGFTPQLISANITTPQAPPAADPAAVCPVRLVAPYNFGSCSVLSYQSSLCSCVGSPTSTFPACLANLGTSAPAVCIRAASCVATYIDQITSFADYQFQYSSACATVASDWHVMQLAATLAAAQPFFGTSLQQACTNQVCNLTSYNSNLAACNYSGVCTLATVGSDPFYVDSYATVVTFTVSLAGVRADIIRVTALQYTQIINAFMTDFANAFSLSASDRLNVRVMNVALPQASNTTGMNITVTLGRSMSQAASVKIVAATSVVMISVVTAVNALPVGASQRLNSIASSTTWSMKVLSSFLTTTRAPTTRVPTTRAPTTRAPPYTITSAPYTYAPYTARPQPTSQPSSSSSATSIFTCFRDNAIAYGSVTGENPVPYIFLVAFGCYLLAMLSSGILIRCQADPVARPHSLMLCFEVLRLVAVCGYGVVTIFSIFYGASDTLGICLADPDGADAYCAEYRIKFSDVSLAATIVTFFGAVAPIIATFYARAFMVSNHEVLSMKVLWYTLVFAGDVLPLLFTPGYLMLEGREFDSGDCVTTPLVDYELYISSVHLGLWVLVAMCAAIDGLTWNCCSPTSGCRTVIPSAIAVIAAVVWGLGVSVTKMATMQAAGWGPYAVTVLMPVFVSIINEVLFLIVYRRPMWSRTHAPADAPVDAALQGAVADVPSSSGDYVVGTVLPPDQYAQHTAGFVASSPMPVGQVTPYSGGPSIGPSGAMYTGATPYTATPPALYNYNDPPPPYYYGSPNAAAATAGYSPATPYMAAAYGNPQTYGYPSPAQQQRAPSSAEAASAASPPAAAMVARNAAASPAAAAASPTSHAGTTVASTTDASPQQPLELGTFARLRTAGDIDVIPIPDDEDGAAAVNPSAYHPPASSASRATAQTFTLNRANRELQQAAPLNDDDDESVEMVAFEPDRGKPHSPREE